jgi:hypothetical protein
MFQACRPAGRLFYLVLAVVIAASGASPVPQRGPTLTNVVDTVYMAGGNPAQGVLIITWPAFVTASGTAVAAGATNVTLGTNGALNVALAANAAANPPGAYYTVVYQLGPGEVRTEYWVVPTSSPATLAQVRTTPGSGTAVPGASVQYVNTALAGKANDNAVVHLAGAEAISGSKTFSAPPNVPTPVGTGDVTNKAYVDAAIATVGAGNFLPTAGGAMTGPLTLSGSPTAPLQAAAKQYVDLIAAAKANLVTGLVPTNELGSGPASALNCLLGNGTWGPCGSSANATAIQSVPVGSSAPGDGQVLTYSAGSGQYAPATPSGGAGSVSVSPVLSQSIMQPANTNFCVNNFAGVTYVSCGYSYSLSPSGTISVGSNTVTLATCPAGILTPASAGVTAWYATPWTWIHIAGTGTPEDAVITGTTCTQQGGATGTITFTAGGTHSAGYTVASSSMGVQEAINAAMQPIPGGSPGSLFGGHTVVPPLPTNYVWTARVSIPGRQARVDFMSSARVVCQMSDTCLYIGDPATSYGGDSVTVTGFHFDAGIINGNFPAVEDNGQSVMMRDFAPFYWYGRTTNTNGAGGDSFGSLIQVDKDEAATIDNLNLIINAPAHCSTDFCTVAVKGTASDASVIRIKNSNLSAQCAMNGVDNQGANTLHISDSVIQGYPQFGVRSTSAFSPNPAVELNNVYFEVGTCTNPLGLGQMGMGVEGAYASIRGTVGPSGSLPQFANSGTTGTTNYYYYVTAHSSLRGSGPSALLLAGYAKTNGSAGNITVKWAQFGTTGTVTYDLVRVQGSSSTVSPPNPAPFGNLPGGSSSASGSVASGTGLVPGTVCSSNICSFTDTVTSSTGAYSVASQIGYFVGLPYWPAGVVLANPTDLGAISEVTTNLYIDHLAGGITPDIVSTYGNSEPSVFPDYCSAPLAEGVWVQCRENDPIGANNSSLGSTLLQNTLSYVALTAGLKGRLIFSGTGSYANGHVLTIADSNFPKTSNTSGHRPTWDANDTYIGMDQASAVAGNLVQLAFGAPISISNYIGSNPDNVSYLERLTAAAKTFKVPVTINGNLTVTGTCTGCGGGGTGTVNSGTATQLAMYSANGAAVSGDSGLTDSGSTLNYTGSNGISAAAGTFSGNVTVNGQLLVAGPWMVSSPIPGTAMTAAGAGTSALGISNDGNFYVSANAGTPQKVATTATSSYFSNLFQEDANDLGEYNGTTAQNLHVYSSYTNSSTWQRTSLGYDATDNYAVVRSENSTSGAAPGLGFWINSGLKWVVDASSNFKPWTDQTYNVGSFNSAGSGSGLRPGTVYVAGNSTSGSGFELGKFASESYELCNDTTNGTVINGLAMLTTSGCAAKSASALVSGAIGVVIANAGASGVATLARAGSVYCSFDASATVVGDYVVPSGTANSGFYPLCHDAGATRPTGTQILGRVLQASSGSATVQMFLDMPGSGVSSGTSNAGTGTCTNQAVTAALTGGPSCTTITSAYVDSSIAATASPVLTGTPTAPTAAANTNTTQIATTAFVLGQASSTTPVMDGTGAVGTSNSYARADHVHPTDTSRAPLASPGLTGTPTAPTATGGDNSTKIATTAYVRAEIYSAWSCAVAGTTATTQYCNWTLPAGITVTGFDLAASTAAAGCTTYPVLQVWDGTAGAELGSYSTAFTSGTNFYTQVTGSANVASGHQLRFKITTAAAGCTTNAAGVVATVTYQMQN